MFHYRRPDLARALLEKLRGRELFGDVTSGLFLAAPRRTGKSTFLRLDLAPALEEDGAVVVYVDLWADLGREPASLIAEAIGRALERYLPAPARRAKAAGMESVGIGNWVRLDLRKIGTVEGATLVDALSALRSASHKPVALIVDEAQHALTSANGETAMAALKSARDQLNRPGEVGLMIVMSGSDRDKLMRLVNTNAAPFYGSAIQRMPTLDRGFIDEIALRIERQQPSRGPIDRARLFEAFQLFGARPEFFGAALTEALSPLREGKERFEDVVLAAAHEKVREEGARMSSDYLALKPLEQAIVWRLLSTGGRFRPYDAEALQFYHSVAGKKATAQQVQVALEALRSRTPPIVWKSARGEYALEDASMQDWYRRHVADGSWPPQDNLARPG